SSLVDELPDLAPSVGDVDLTTRILAERRHQVDGGPGALEIARIVGDAAGDDARHGAAAAPRRATVGEEVATAEVRHGAAAVDVAARYRAALRVRVGEDRERHLRLGRGARREVRRGIEAGVALEDVPAPVAARRQRRGLVVDLLDRVLADVADVE